VLQVTPYTSLKLRGRTAELPRSDLNRQVILFTWHFVLFFTLDKSERLIPEGLGIAEKTKEKFLAPALWLYECMDGYTISTVDYLYSTRSGQSSIGFARRYLRLPCQGHRFLRGFVRNQIDQEVRRKDRRGKKVKSV
jgi:hypothetical protein